MMRGFWEPNYDEGGDVVRVCLDLGLFQLG